MGGADAIIAASAAQALGASSQPATSAPQESPFAGAATAVLPVVAHAAPPAATPAVEAAANGALTPTPAARVTETDEFEIDEFSFFSASSVEQISPKSKEKQKRKEEARKAAIASAALLHDGKALGKKDKVRSCRL